MGSRAGTSFARSVGVLGLLGAVGVVAAITWGAARTPRRAAIVPRREPVLADPAAWPAAQATLTVLAPPATAGAEPAAPLLRVMLDPGHGARANRGNTSTFCVAEQDAMMEVAVALADRLEATGGVEVRLAREPGCVVEYAARLADAAAWGADAFVSLHSDVRGKIERWAPEAGLDCPIALDAPGFSVLYSDEGDADLKTRRRDLGLAAARRMADAGFLPYSGVAYVGLYGEEAQAGLFVDRHAPEQRIFVLRRAAMPSILIETHNALDPREAARWADPDTLDAFAGALAAALADAFPACERRGGT
jgi:N-acetylmuramoyl-L-alanine amidase